MNEDMNADVRAEEGRLTALRFKMVEGQLKARGISNELIINAFLKVPRHAFVPPAQSEEAYCDWPLPIGEGQTISQPYIVALMLQELRIKRGENVLEIGTGSGYQTALLAEMGCEVYTVERIGSLQRRARRALEELGYEGIHYMVGDGTLGWPENAPFDCITVGASAPNAPPSLAAQLAENGRLILPIGGRGSQELTVIEKIDGRTRERFICGCVFVQLIGEEGWSGRDW